MANRTWLLIVSLIFFTGYALANDLKIANKDNDICEGKVESMQLCHWIEGKISIYNGTPSIRIHQSRSKRIYAVVPSEDEWMPTELKEKLTLDNVITAKFRICPITNNHKKGMRDVCVNEVKIKNIIENH